ncbi:MAG: AAA family ATPase, partial [Waterburya sp.]
MNKTLVNLLNPIQLTSQQELAFATIKSFIDNKDAKFLKFSGAAGTGKSTLISQVLFWLKNEHSDLNLAVASPTNKALRNIRLMANKALNTDASEYFSFYTLAQILGYYLDISIYTGKDYLTNGNRTKQQRICEYDLVIIDEYSMIDERLLKDIINAIHNTQTKVLFCGDPFQLPPVKAARPPVCALDIEEITLFDVVRYDGELAVVAEEIRSNDTYQKLPYPFESSDDGTIVKYEREISWKKAAERYFQDDAFVADKNSVRFLAYTNKRCEDLSSYVRNALYGMEAAQGNPYLPN